MLPLHRQTFNERNTTMGELLKIVAYLLIICLMLVFALPLLWLVIKLIGWLFGGLLCLFSGTVLWVIIGIACIILIVSALAD